MNTKNIILGLVVLVIVGFGAFNISLNKDGMSVSSDNVVMATVYKSSNCGCCEVYASYMKKEGYGVEVVNEINMDFIKEERSIPYDIYSCHTMDIDGYVVEGHVPEVAIEKLLSERPDIKGIGMGGMPSGSPGMPGPKTSNFEIYEINNDGSLGSIFMTI